MWQNFNKKYEWDFLLFELEAVMILSIMDKIIQIVIDVKMKNFLEIWQNNAGLLKVSKFQKQIFLFSFEPKNKRNYFLNSALASKMGQILYKLGGI